MLRKLFALVIGLVLVNEAATSQAVGPLELIEKAITARGGKEALTKYQAKTLTVKGKMAAGDAEVDYTATWYIYLPNRFRAEYQLTIDGNSTNMIQVSNGEKLWQKINDAAAVEMPDHVLKGTQTYLQVLVASQLVPLLDKDKYSVSSNGEFEVKGKKAIALNVKNKDGLDALLYFDSKTNLLVKQEYGSKHVVTGQDALVENYLSNYKKTNDVTESMQWELQLDGKTFIVSTIENMQFDEQLDVSLFEKPE